MINLDTPKRILFDLEKLTEELREWTEDAIVESSPLDTE